MQNLLPLNNGAIETFAGERASPLLLHGFLFDMNAFFEQLITRFLTENLTGYTVKGQHRLTAMMAYQPEHNPQRRRPPPSIRIDPGMLGGGR